MEISADYYEQIAIKQRELDDFIDSLEASDFLEKAKAELIEARREQINYDLQVIEADEQRQKANLESMIDEKKAQVGFLQSQSSSLDLMAKRMYYLDFQTYRKLYGEALSSSSQLIDQTAILGHLQTMLSRFS